MLAYYIAGELGRCWELQIKGSDDVLEVRHHLSQLP